MTDSETNIMNIFSKVALSALFVFFVSLRANCEENTDSVKTTNLDEIEISASRKIVARDGSVTTIKVHGTPFSQMGSVIDMLGNMPGLYNNGNGIQVAGSGTPVYYLDGRELTDIQQLSILQADNIKNVKIDKAPGAQYGANAQAVIHLTSYRPLSDNIFLNVTNTIGLRRKASDFPGVNFKAIAGNFVTSLSYQYGTSGSEVRETYFREIEHPAYTFKSEQSRKLPKRNLSNTVNWSGEYQFNPSSRIGIYYYFNDSQKKDNENGINKLTDEFTTTSMNIDNRGMSKSSLHSISGMYDYVNGYNSLHISQDYAASKSDYQSSVTESQESLVNQMRNSNISSYRIATTNLRTSFVLPWRVSVAAGAKFVYVKSNSFLETTRHDYGECLNKNRWNITEYTPQVYIALGRMFGKVLLSPGIRYEYTIRNINNRDQINETDNLYEYKNSSFYPYLTIKYTGKRVNAYLQYSRKVTQPDFNVLSGVAYIDTLTYSLGNPDLKATTENTIISGIDIGDFTFGIKYSHRKNPFENVEILKESEKNIVYATCVNFPKQEEFSASFSYGSAIGSFNYYGEVDLNLDKSYFDYGCNPATRSSFAVDAEANVSYQIKDFSIYANYTLQGRRTSLATTQKSVQNLNFGVSGRFLKKRLSINLELMDVMGKANYNNLAISYSHISNGTRGTSDMRGIRLRISYTIFNKPIRINGSRENEEILKRIK